MVHPDSYRAPMFRKSLSRADSEMAFIPSKQILPDKRVKFHSSLVRAMVKTR